MPELIIHKRKLPHWIQSNAVYFVTFTLTNGILTDSEKQIVFDHILEGNKKFYTLHSVVVMHDHVHLMLQCDLSYSLIRVMRGIKGVSAYKINKSRNTKGKLWINESYDRIIRDENEYGEKMTYMFNNPIKKGFIEDTYNYKWWYMNQEISRFG